MRNMEALVSQRTRDLAQASVRDGEGATKFVEIRVTGARTPSDAKAVARAVAGLPVLALQPEDLPALRDNDQIGGTELEGVLVRALRQHATAEPSPGPEPRRRR